MSVQMCLLGSFALEDHGESIAIPSQRLQSLLAYLAFNRPAPQSRQHLAFTLWPDSSESQAHTNLRTLLHRLQAVLPDSDSLLHIDSQAVAWQPNVTLSLDVDDFRAHIQSAGLAQMTGDDAAAQESLERAVACHKGELLPGCYDEWILAERERLQQELYAALEQLAALLERHRGYAEAIPYARRLVQLDLLNEAACITLVRLHLSNGERASALRVYHSCASALRTELGIAPGSALHAVYDQILASETLQLATGATDLLVGRNREWQQMQTAWQIVNTGQPRLLVLAGEAGIGKTRLAEEFVRWANQQGFLTATTHCYAGEGELTYGPITTWLRSDTLRSNLAHLSAADRAEVARLIPDLFTPEVKPAGQLTEQWQRQRLFEAIARAVIGSGRPVVLLVDDMQWCPRDSLEWLRFLLRLEMRPHVLVVGTVRVEEVGDDHPLCDLCNLLRREDRITEIALTPLIRAETGVLAEHIAGRPLSEEQVGWLYDETEGNPLFVVETVRTNPSAPAADVSDSCAGDGTNLPIGVRAVIARRLSQIAPETRPLLDVAAVMGRSLPFGVLARATGGDEDTLVRGLDELWQRRIVREHGADAYDFTHDKLRTVAYANLSAARQRLLHRRVAEALEAEYATNSDAVSGQIAAHYERAGLMAPAVAYYQRAAQHARRLLSSEAAIAYYERALGLLDNLTELQAVPLYDQLGEVLHLVGRYEDARRLWQQALSLTAADRAGARAHLYRQVGNTWRDQYHYDEAMRAYDAAETALFAGGDSTTDEARCCWMQIEWERITTLYWLGQVTSMLQLIDRLRPYVEQYDTEGQRARLHQLNAVALLRQTRYSVTQEATQHARAYLAYVQSANDSVALPAAHFQLGFALLWAGELAAAEAECHAAYLLAQQSSDVSLQGRCLTYLTVIARKQDCLETVRDYAERSLHIAVTGQMHDYVGAAHGNLAWVAWRKADLTGTRAHGDAAIAAWEKLPSPYMFEWIARWPLIGVLEAAGDLQAASIHMRVLLHESQQRPPAAIEAELEAALQALAAQQPAVARHHMTALARLANADGFL